MYEHALRRLQEIEIVLPLNESQSLATWHDALSKAAGWIFPAPKTDERFNHGVGLAEMRAYCPGTTLNFFAFAVLSSFWLTINSWDALRDEFLRSRGKKTSDFHRWGILFMSSDN